MDRATADGKATETPRRRRKLAFAEQVGTVSLPTDPETSDPESAVRKGAQAWAKSKKLILGTWSTPRFCPDDKYRLTARCHRCQKCFDAEGTVFQFTGRFQGVQDTILELSVAKDGTCSGEPPVLRAHAGRDEAEEVTAEGRQAVHEAADNLLETGRPATAGSVKMKLGDQAQALQISARKIRNLLRSRKFSHGGATRRFSESVRDFKSFLDTLDGSMLSVPVLQFDPFFAYVALLEPFLNRIAELKPARISICADFTFNFTHMNYEYGLICASFAGVPVGTCLDVVFG